MTWFIQRNAITQRSTCKHTQRTGDLRSFIGENIAKHILGNYHVKISRTIDKLHCRIIYQHVFKLDIRIFCLTNAMNNLAPHTARF